MKITSNIKKLLLAAAMISTPLMAQVKENVAVPYIASYNFV